MPKHEKILKKIDKASLLHLSCQGTKLRFQNEKRKHFSRDKFIVKQIC